jgi:phage FluMu protein Com
VKLSCPGCAKVLSVRDDAAGKRVKCPGCAEVLKVPSSTAIGTAPPKSARPAPAPPPAEKPPAPARKRRECPECGEPLERGADECAECGWNADEPVRKPARRKRSRDDDEPGTCYVQIRRDEVNLVEAIEKRLEKLFKTELVECELTDEDDDPPQDLGPNDIVITGKVTECDYGSQIMRYFLTFITAFGGPGACRLEVQALVETDDGERRVLARSRHGVGVFGGSGTSLMRLNVKAVSRRIADDALRHVTGVRFLNAQAYNCSAWSLGLGLASLIPCFGFVCGPIGLVLGVIALVTILRRNLPAGKWLAIPGTFLSLLGTFGNVVFVILASKH